MGRFIGSPIIINSDKLKILCSDPFPSNFQDEILIKSFEILILGPSEADFIKEEDENHIKK